MIGITDELHDAIMYLPEGKLEEINNDMMRALKVSSVDEMQALADTDPIRVANTLNFIAYKYKVKHANPRIG